MTGGTVYDGSGGPGVRADVGISDGRLVYPVPPGSAATAASTLPADGLIVCPALIDIHTHSDLTLLSNPLGDSKIQQGVGTEVIGNCGLGLAPLPDPDGPAPAADDESLRVAAGYLDLDPEVQVRWRGFDEFLATLQAARPAMNIAALVPHLPLHAQVVGLDDTAADAGQIARIAELAGAAMDAGAVGVSTGLMYAPLSYVHTDELMALGAAVAARGKLFAWHIRSYADDVLDAVGEAIAVAAATGCRLQISHLTAVGRRNWGDAVRALAMVDAARADGVDVGVDIYPYLAGNAPLSQLLPDWAQQGGAEEFTVRLTDPQVRARVAAEWAESAYWVWEDITINAVSGSNPDDNPELAGILGRTVAELAEAAGVSAAEQAMQLLAAYGGAVTMVAFGRSEDDLRRILLHPATVVASDGQAIAPDGATGAAGDPHPRSYGCFPRYLAHFTGSGWPADTGNGVAGAGAGAGAAGAGADAAGTGAAGAGTDAAGAGAGAAAGSGRPSPAQWADAIRRCTSAAAERVGLTDRGRIADGLAADLLLFDPEQLTDVASFDAPQQFPAGIRAVLVGGQLVIDAGADTGARPGEVLRV